MSYLKLKGLDSLFKQECSSILPSYGFTALKTEVLPNIRFQGPYGPKTEPYGCQRQIRAEQQDKDCPQDWTSAFIQQLFPSPDGVNFVANQGSTVDPLSKLPLDTIGRLLSVVRKFDQTKNTTEVSFSEKYLGSGQNMKHRIQFEMDKINQLEKFTFGVLQALSPQWVYQKTKKGKRPPPIRISLENKLEELKNRLISCGESRVSVEILNLENNLNKLRALEDEIGAHEISAVKGKQWDEIAPFAKIFFHALKEQQQESKNPNWIYPPETIEQTLLAYAWRRANGKEDYLKLAQGIPECIEEEEKSWILADTSKPIRLKTLNESKNEVLNKKRKSWIEGTYSIEQYKKWKAAFQNVAPTPAQIHEIQENPELLAFYAYSVDAVDNPLPPLIGGAEAAHKSLGKNPKSGRKYNLYADCGEASLRNFFNILLYDKEKGIFDTSRLEQAQKDHNLHLHAPKGKKNEKGLLAFYRGRNEIDSKTGDQVLSLRNTDPTQVEDNRVRDDWSRRVASSVPGGNYLKGGGQCEINAGINNMQTIIGTLLGDPKWNEYQDPKEKWNRICELFSRQDPPFDLDWTVQGGTKDNLGKDKEVTLEFSINGVKAFTWYFGGGHFSVEGVAKGKGWRSSAASFVTGATHGRSFRSSFAWFVGEENINSVYKNNPESSLLWSYPLRNSEKKYDALRFLFNNQIVAFYPLAQGWIKKLPLHDLEAQIKINAIYADTGYPLGEDGNHPGIIPRTLNYTSIKKEELEKLFGKEVAKKLGRAVKDPHGHIWGDLLQDEQGNLIMNWEQSMATCLALNISWNPTIHGELEAIKALSDQVQRYQAYEKLDQKTRTEIPNYGKACTVPTEKMWTSVSQDLKKTGSYIPQYFPNLKRSFWSSSNNQGKRLIFSGGNGTFMDGSRGGWSTTMALTRCSCEVATAVGN